MCCHQVKYNITLQLYTFKLILHEYKLIHFLKSSAFWFHSGNPSKNVHRKYNDEVQHTWYLTVDEYASSYLIEEAELFWILNCLRRHWENCPNNKEICHIGASYRMLNLWTNKSFHLNPLPSCPSPVNPSNINPIDKSKGWHRKKDTKIVASKEHCYTRERKVDRQQNRKVTK